MRIHTYSLGEMQANCYLLELESSAILVDPADSADFLLEKLSRMRLTLKSMYATHGHFDHVMAAGEIQLSFPHVPLYIHNDDMFLLARLGETARHFLGYDPQVVPPSNVKQFVDKEIHFDGVDFRIMHTPGHTPGSVAYYLKDENMVFTGDTLFQAGVGRYDFSYSDKSALEKSVSSLLKLPPETKAYPGHGEATLIVDEKSVASSFF